jgi:hypothetical protein
MADATKEVNRRLVFLQLTPLVVTKPGPSDVEGDVTESLHEK